MLHTFTHKTRLETTCGAPKFVTTEKSLNIDMEQLNHLTSREINFNFFVEIDFAFLLQNHIYGKIRFGHEAVSMTSGAQKIDFDVVT